MYITDLKKKKGRKIKMNHETLSIHIFQIRINKQIELNSY